MAEIVNTNADLVRLYIEHGTGTDADIKNRVQTTHGLARIQCFLELLMVVSQVVKDHIGDDGTCAAVAMYLHGVLNHVQLAANGALPDWGPLSDDLKTVSVAIVGISSKSLKQATVYKIQKAAFNVVILMALSYSIICNSDGELKELCTAFLPQAVAVVFHLVEISYQAQTVRLRRTLETAAMLKKYQGLVSIILEDLIMA